MTRPPTTELEQLRARIAELERTNTVLEEIVARSPGHFHVFDTQGRLQYASHTGLRILRKYGGDAIGKNWRELDFPEDLVNFFEAELLEVAFSGTPVRRKMRLPTEGGPRDFEYRLTPIRDDEARVTHVLLMARDMTETREAQAAVRQRLRIERLVAALSHRFINVAPEDVDDEISAALERIGEFEDVDRSYLFEMSADLKIACNTHEWCREGIAPQIDKLQAVRVEDFPNFIAPLLRGDNLHVPRVSDLAKDSPELFEFLSEQGILSLVCIPVSRNGRLIAFLGFDAVRFEKAWSEDDCHLLRAVGEILVLARERRNSEEALRASPIYFRAAAEHIPNPIAYVDSVEQFRFANLAFRRALGLEDQEFSGKSLRNVLGEIAYQAWRHAVRRVISGEEIAMTLTGLEGDGGDSVTRLIPHRENGKVTGFVIYRSGGQPESPTSP